MKSIFNSPVLCSKRGVVIIQHQQSQMDPFVEDKGFLLRPSSPTNVSSKQTKYAGITELYVSRNVPVGPSWECIEGKATCCSNLNKCEEAKRIEENLKQIDIDFADDCTQGSDNSKCSEGFEKPKAKNHLSIPLDKQIPVLDMTPSRMKGNVLVDRDNTTCTWSDSEDGAIPTFIYIRRDIPPAVPDDEALGQQYNLQGRKTEDSSPASGLFLKGLRIFTFGGSGSNAKTHLDDDASEAFQQTLLEL